MDRLSGQTFSVGPLIEMEERHGGPVWYNLLLVEVEFYEDNRVEIRLDKSLSKKPIRVDYTTERFSGNYQLIVNQDNYYTGSIELQTGVKCFFESVPKNVDLLFLEKPPFWKESMVLQLMRKEE
ncbi:MAG: hypothetical protein GYB31_07160 [Bacteroidetes bacterium]|nr:hypothetical protein [Bacteroidota bacterium]